MSRSLLTPLLLLLLCTCGLAGQARKATFYHKKYYGRLTSTGEKLDAKLYTAASKKHAWGTILEVTNKRNGRKVQVRVNDCGPHHPEAILDLSQAAAVELDMIKDGRVPVDVRVVRTSDSGPTCHRGAWAKKLKAKGQPIPPPPPAWDPVETQGALTPAVVQETTSDVTTLPVQGPVTTQAPATTSGLVGFYPMNAQKRKTSTGETYLHSGLTAATSRYPYNTILQLTNVVSGESVRVRVNDCGPVQPDRVMNVSRAAALDLGILATGPAQMNVRVVRYGLDGDVCDRGAAPKPQKPTTGTKVATTTPPTTATPTTNPPAEPTAADKAPAREFAPDELLFGVKLAAFKNEAGALKFIDEVKQKGFSPAYSISDGKYHRVYAGKFLFQSEAEEFKDLLKKEGYNTATVRRVQ